MKLNEIRAPATDSRDIIDDFFEKLTERCIPVTHVMRETADLVEVSIAIMSMQIDGVVIVWKLRTDTPGERLDDGEAILVCKLARRHLTPENTYSPPIWKEDGDAILVTAIAALPSEVSLTQDREYLWKRLVEFTNDIKRS